ncbi:MAG TPA: hypothetical protein VGY57_03140 [Vicinamibacterales bacterium]|nr:hypothetical protein [Vicinamibacterales bacterium]
MRRLHAAFAIAAVVAAIACGSSTSPSPPVNIAGTWNGTVSDSQLGTGTVTATINQSNSAVAGTWAASYANAANNNSGTLAGTVDGSNVSMTLKPSAPGSCAILLSTTSDGRTMNGNYSTVNCTEIVTGQIKVIWQ